MYKQLTDLFNVILVEFPEESKDLIESISFLKETLNDIMKAIKDRMLKSLENRDIASVEKYTGIAKEINAFEDYLSHFAEKSDNRTTNEAFTEPDEDINVIEMSVDNTQKIDQKMEHSLNEDFTYVRPYGFRFRKKMYICKTWKEVLVKTCEILFILNKKRIMDFANIQNTGRIKPKYFSTDPNDFRRPEYICGAIYVETNLSSNSIKQLIIQLLNEFGFVIDDYVVYFRTDGRKK